MNWRSLIRILTGNPLRLIVDHGLADGLAKWFKGPEAFVSVPRATSVPLPHPMAWVTIATEILALQPTREERE